MALETVERTDEIETGSDVEFERRWWRFQKICWALMLVLLAAGVAGLLGAGPLGRTTAYSPDQTIEVHYERLARRETPAIMELRLGKEAIASGTACVQLSRVYVDKLRIKDIVPKPLSTVPLADGIRLSFRTDPAAGPATILIVQDPSAPGLFQGDISVEGASSVHLWQLVYP